MTLTNISDIYKDNPRSLESKVVQTAYELELIGEYMRKNSGWTDSETVDFIFENIGKINYSKNHLIAISEYARGVYKKSSGLSEDLKDEYREIVQQYINGNLSEEEFLNEIYSYSRKNNLKNQKAVMK